MKTVKVNNHDSCDMFVFENEGDCLEARGLLLNERGMAIREEYFSQGHYLSHANMISTQSRSVSQVIISTLAENRWVVIQNSVAAAPSSITNASSSSSMIRSTPRVPVTVDDTPEERRVAFRFHNGEQLFNALSALGTKGYNIEELEGKGKAGINFDSNAFYVNSAEQRLIEEIKRLDVFHVTDLTQMKAATESKVVPSAPPMISVRVEQVMLGRAVAFKFQNGEQFSTALRSLQIDGHDISALASQRRATIDHTTSTFFVNSNESATIEGIKRFDAFMVDYPTTQRNVFSFDRRGGAAPVGESRWQQYVAQPAAFSCSIDIAGDTITTTAASWLVDLKRLDVDRALRDVMRGQRRDVTEEDIQLTTQALGLGDAASIAKGTINNIRKSQLTRF